MFDTLERDIGPEFARAGRDPRTRRAGDFGTKTGAGFGTYDDAERDALLLERDRRYAALAKLLDDS